MASSQTTNYQLPQWAKSDRIQMSDFNAAMSTIDAALAASAAGISAAPKIAVGSYIGTGTCGESNPSSLTFPFTPKLVGIVADSYSCSESGTLLIRGQTKSSGIGAASNSGCALNMTVAWSGNSVSWHAFYDYKQLNKSDVTYFYFAIG